MNAFQIPTRPSVMNTPQAKKSERCARVHSDNRDYLKPKNKGNFQIDPDSEASVNKRRALVRGGI